MADFRLIKDVPESGTWAVLWPGYYGPFTACAMEGEWGMCEDTDLAFAEMWAPDPFQDMGSGRAWDRMPGVRG